MRPDQLLIIVTARLEAIGIPYCVGGSFASGVYGRARTTYDLDLLIAPLSIHLSDLIAAFSGDFDLNASELLTAFQYAPTCRDNPNQRAIAKAYHHKTQFRIDFFLSSGREFEQSQLQRRIRQVISVTPPAEADFTAPEDIILAKLEWFRIGNYASTHQWPDVQAILLVQTATLDWEYLNHWATILNVRDLLDALVAGNPPPSFAHPSNPSQQLLFE